MPRANAGGTTQAQFDAVLARLNAVEQVNQSVVMRLNAAEQVNHEMVARLNVVEQTNHNLIGQLKSGRKHSRTMAGHVSKTIAREVGAGSFRRGFGSNLFPLGWWARKGSGDESGKCMHCPFELRDARGEALEDVAYCVQ